MLLTDADQILMERYFESVLLRFKDGRYDLIVAVEELAQAFNELAKGAADLREHLLGVIEAGDDA
jgi:hypothetical protein